MGRAATRDSFEKSRHIHGLLMVEFRAVLATPDRIIWRPFRPSGQKSQIQMMKQRRVIKFFTEEGDTGIEIYRHLKDNSEIRSAMRKPTSPRSSGRSLPSTVCHSLEQSIGFRPLFTEFFFLSLSVISIGFVRLWNLGSFSEVQPFVSILKYRRDFVCIQRNQAVVLSIQQIGIRAVFTMWLESNLRERGQRVCHAKQIFVEMLLLRRPQE
jgi:hypothetical protein